MKKKKDFKSETKDQGRRLLNFSRSCSTQLSLKFILLINVKMPLIVGILTFISRINMKNSGEFKSKKKNIIFQHL